MESESRARQASLLMPFVQCSACRSLLALSYSGCFELCRHLEDLVRGQELQGYLAHKKQRPPRTLQ